MHILKCSCKRPIQIEPNLMCIWDEDKYKKRVYTCVCGKRYYQDGRLRNLIHSEYGFVTEILPDDWDIEFIDMEGESEPSNNRNNI